MGLQGRVAAYKKFVDITLRLELLKRVLERFASSPACVSSLFPCNSSFFQGDVLETTMKSNVHSTHVGHLIDFLFTLSGDVTRVRQDSSAIYGTTRMIHHVLSMYQMQLLSVAGAIFDEDSTEAKHEKVAHEVLLYLL
jgi:hypothetical protein